MKMKHFICPICGTPLSLSDSGASLLCKREPKPHCFDIASAGYVNLDRSGKDSGDSKECVRHRSAFLEKDHYRPISDKISELAFKYTKEGSVVLDAGCGEGYYTANLAKAMRSSPVIGVDISKYAAEYGAKRAKREGITNLSFAVASIFTLPIESGTVGCVTNVFAPCPTEEFERVLIKGGILITVSAGERHLMGLKEALYESVYLNEGRADLPTEDGFTLIESANVSFAIKLSSNEEIKHLFAMTPYYYRTSQKDKEKLDSLSSLETEIQTEITVYRKNG